MAAPPLTPASPPPLDPRQFHKLLRRAIVPPLLLLGGLAAVLLWQVSTLLTAYRWVDHSDQVIAHVVTLQNQLLGMQNGLRGYVITGDESQLDAYERGARSIEPSYAQLLEEVSDDARQTQRVTDLGPRIQEWIVHANFYQMLARYDALKEQALLPDYGVRVDDALNAHGKRLMDELQGAL
ncbi:MAG: CHASE3 domain-containing protein, partial [Tepidisphaeraceae bacterium]